MKFNATHFWIVLIVSGLLVGGVVIILNSASDSSSLALDENLRQQQSRENVQPEIQTVTEEGRYTHSRYGFSLIVSSSTEVQQYKEGNASETIVFTDTELGTYFQVFVTPYVDDEITKERLAMDVPGGVIREPTEVVIGDGIHAVLFYSEDPAVGTLRELWFMHEGFLYEVSTPEQFDAYIASVMDTIQFVSQ